MKEFVIYTVMTGGYDDILQPVVVDDRFDYILFSDQHIGEAIGVWQVRGIECELTDFVYISRYPKILPHLFLSKYKASLYHDANIQIKTQDVYNRIVDLFEKKVLWAGMNHPHHDCIYDELFLVVNLGYEHDYVAVDWGHKIVKEGMPMHIGFYENSIIFRTHTESTEKICETWWNTMLKVSRRDQFTLRYVLWKLDVPMVYIYSQEQTPRNSPHFIYVTHKSTSNKKFVKLNLCEYIRSRTKKEMKGKLDEVKQQYYKIYKSRCPILYLHILGIYYGILYYLPKMLNRKIMHIIKR